MFNKNCLIPPQKKHNTYHQQKFRNQDRSISNIGDQAALNTDERKNNLQTCRYARTARTILEDMRTPLEWKRPATGYFQAFNHIVVTVANRERAQSTHDGALEIPGLPPGARYAHVIPGIKHSLLSIVRLCNAGCEIVFGGWGLNVEVRCKGKVVMKGKKRTINGLWYVPITKITSEDNP